MISRVIFLRKVWYKLMIKVGIIGATGYAGAELVRLLTAHRGAEIIWYGSKSYVGQEYAQIYQNMFQIIEGPCLDEIGRASCRERV